VVIEDGRERVLRRGMAGSVAWPAGRGPACALVVDGTGLGLGSGERRTGLVQEPPLRALAFNAPDQEAPRRSTGRPFVAVRSRRYRRMGQRIQVS